MNIRITLFHTIAFVIGLLTLQEGALFCAEACSKDFANSPDGKLIHNFSISDISNERILDFARNANNQQDPELQRYSLWLFSYLVQSEYAIEEARAAAAIGITSPDVPTKACALNLYAKLVEKGQALAEAREVAQSLRSTCLILIHAAVSEIYTALLSQGVICYKEATRVAKYFHNSIHPATLSNLELCIALVKKDQAFEEAIQAGVNARLKSPFKEVRQKADCLLDLCAKRDPSLIRRWATWAGTRCLKLPGASLLLSRM